MIILKGRSATREELILVHSKEYIDSIKDTENLKPKELKKQAETYNSVYLHPETWTSACISTGSLLQVVDSVLNGESQSGIAIVRPPGHHAGENIACGFCIFNNIAIAAKYAVEFHHVKRYYNRFSFNRLSRVPEIFEKTESKNSEQRDGGCLNGLRREASGVIALVIFVIL